MSCPGSPSSDTPAGPAPSGSWMDTIVQKILQQLVTAQHLRRPFQDLEHPSKYGMRKCQFVKIPVDGSADSFITGWLCAPDKYEGDADEADVEVKIPQDATVVLYCHGNAETVSQFHRRELYKIYQKQGYYLLAFDYRGYGFSSAEVQPNEDTMVKDTQVEISHMVKVCYPWIYFHFSWLLCHA